MTMLKTRVPLSTLQLSGLFIYSLLTAIALLIALAAFAVPLIQNGLLGFYEGFYSSSTLAILLPLLAAAFSYILYGARKRDEASYVPLIAIVALTAVFAAALSETVLAFTRYALIGTALVYICTAATNYGPAFVRSAMAALAIFAACGSLLLIGVEGFLLRQHIASKFPTKQALDFGDVVTGKSPGRLAPGLDEPMLLGNGSVGRVLTNPSGFRANWPITLPKPEGEFRILLLGDSFSFGFRTDQTKTAAAILESRLREKLQTDVRVYTAWTENQAGLLNWLQGFPDRFEADLIVHGLCLGNDLGSSFWPERPVASDLKQKQPIPQRFLDADNFRPDYSFVPAREISELKKRLRLTTALRLAFFPTPIFAGFQVQPGAPPMWNSQNDMGLFLKDAAYHAPIMQVFERNMITAANMADPIPLHAIIFPQRFQQSEREWATQVAYYGLDPAAFDLDLPNRQINAICDANDLNCYDLLPHFRERGQELLHYPYDMHWNDAGNLLAGEAMAEYLAPFVSSR